MVAAVLLAVGGAMVVRHGGVRSSGEGNGGGREGGGEWCWKKEGCDVGGGCLVREGGIGGLWGCLQLVEMSERRRGRCRFPTKGGGLL